MRLQFFINSDDTSKQFSSFLKSLSLANSIRKSVMFKFKETEMMIISTSNVVSFSSTGGSSKPSTSSQSESQLWLKLNIEELFQKYIMKTKRLDKSITMELAIDPLIQVLKKYDQMMRHGDQALGNIDAPNASSGNLEIKMMNVPPEWNMPVGKSSGYGSLRVSFEEQVPGKPTSIKHITYLPIKLVSSQHELIQPVINNEHLVYILPSFERDDMGKQFGKFMKRLDRFSGLEHLKICGDKQEIKLLVDEMDWYMEVKWNGILDVLSSKSSVVNDLDTQVHSQPSNKTVAHDHTEKEEEEEEEEGEQQVVIRSRDWKLCSRLFETLGDQTFLCISAKQYCLFNCVVKKESIDNDTLGDNDDSSNKFMDISFYISNSKGT